MCLISDTCRRLQCSPKDIFECATRQKGFTNNEECARYRLERWWKYGEIPTYVQSYCNCAVLVKQVMKVHLYEGAEPVAYDGNGNQMELFPPDMGQIEFTMPETLRESTGHDPHRAA